MPQCNTDKHIDIIAFISNLTPIGFMFQINDKTFTAAALCIIQQKYLVSAAIIVLTR